MIGFKLKIDSLCVDLSITIKIIQKSRRISAASGNSK